MSEDIIGQIANNGDAAVISFGKSSICNVEEISAAFERVLGFVNTNHPMRVVFDFKGVKFFSSQILGLLLETRNVMSSYNGRVFISSINPQLHRVFKITNLDKVFTFFPDAESALCATRSD